MAPARSILLCLLLAGPSAARAQVEDPTFLAQKRFEAGRQLYDAGDFAGALSSFRSSFGLVPSPNTALYVARSLRHLGRLGEAVAQYAETIRLGREHPEAERYEPAVRAARREARELEPRIARLSVKLQHAPPGTRIRLDARILDRPPRRLPLDAGPARLVVEPPGGPPITRPLTLLAGKHLELEIDLRPAPAPPATQPVERAPASTSGRLRRGLQIGGWTTAAAGTASLIAAVICWRLAQDRFDELDGACNSGTCPADQRATRDAGQRLELATNVTLGLGIGLVVTGGALLLSSLLADRPGPALSSDGSGLSLTWEL